MLQTDHAEQTILLCSGTFHGSHWPQVEPPTNLLHSLHPDQTDLTFSFYLIPLYQTADILKTSVLCLSVCCSKYLNPVALSFLNVNCYFRPISMFGKIALSDWIKVLKRSSRFLCSRSQPAQCEAGSETKQITLEGHLTANCTLGNEKAWTYHKQVKSMDSKKRCT